MHKPIKYVEKAFTYVAKVPGGLDKLNSVNPAAITPKWADKPLLKSYQKTKPPLGWPRTPIPLPKCVPEIRQQILDASCHTKSSQRKMARSRPRSSSVTARF